MPFDVTAYYQLL